MKQRPIQTDVDYYVPPMAEAKQCKVESAKTIGQSGWIVVDPNGRMLRRFIDTNKDRKIDMWCYYKEGVEVYRDIDSNYDLKADQYRWLGTAGQKWGRDKNQDREIDEWISISAEEVSSEVVAAMRDRNAKRFLRVLLKKPELEKLGLGSSESEEVLKRIANTSAKISNSIKSAALDPKAEWLHFGGTKPAVIPKGGAGATRDIYLYDNVAALVANGNKNTQVAIGTLFKVGDGWRVVDLPSVIEQGKVPDVGGFLMRHALALSPSVSPQSIQGVTKEVEELIQKFEVVSKSIEKTSDASELQKLSKNQADTLAELVEKDDRFRSNWVRQFADTVSGGFQSGRYKDGLDRLKSFLGTIKTMKTIKENDLAYVEFRYVNANYSYDLSNASEKTFQKVQDKWIDDLKSFANKYPTSEDTADALWQLALADELNGKEDKAEELYARVVKNFKGSRFFEKAQGALKRLNSEGKPFQLKGKTTDARAFDIASAKGKVVIVHYWATWCSQCITEFKTIDALLKKHDDEGLVAVGINVDTDSKTLAKFLKTDKAPSWPQLYENGGLDGRLANEYGIGGVPIIMVIDREGKVVKRNIAASDIEDEIKAILRD